MKGEIKKSEEENSIIAIEENEFFFDKYSYSTFEEMEDKKAYDFYAIVYDSSFPKEVEYNSSLSGQKGPILKYSVEIKLLGQGTNSLNDPNNLSENIVTLYIQAKEQENVPYIHQIGDVIRVHKGIYLQKKQKNVYLDLLKVQNKGSWCVFSSNPDKDGDKPYLCSDKKYIYESQDKKLISRMREFSHQYLANNYLNYSNQNNLVERAKGESDKDLLVQVVHKLELKDHLILFVQDATDGCELHVLKYFNFIKENDVIRVRSYKVYNSAVLLLNEYGNILKIPLNSQCYKTFMDNLSKKLREYLKKEN